MTLNLTFKCRSKSSVMMLLDSPYVLYKFEASALSSPKFTSSILLTSPSFKFQPLSLYYQPFSSYMPFHKKPAKQPQNGIEHYGVEILHIYALLILRVPNFSPLRSMIRHFQAVIFFFFRFCQ